MNTAKIIDKSYDRGLFSSKKSGEAVV